MKRPAIYVGLLCCLRRYASVLRWQTLCRLTWRRCSKAFEHLRYVENRLYLACQSFFGSVVSTDQKSFGGRHSAELSRCTPQIALNTTAISIRDAYSKNYEACWLLRRYLYSRITAVSGCLYLPFKMPGYSDHSNHTSPYDWARLIIYAKDSVHVSYSTAIIGSDFVSGGLHLWHLGRTYNPLTYIVLYNSTLNM